MIRKTQIGIVWIDGDQEKATDGYICTSGIEGDIQRVSLASLSPQRLWVCNLKQHKFKPLALGGYLNLRHSKFFGIALSDIAMDLNLGSDLETKLPIFFTVINGIYDQLFDNFQFDIFSEKYSVPAIIKPMLLRAELLKRPTLQGQPSRDLEYAITNSMQLLQSTQNRNIGRDIASDTSITYTVRYSRTPYFLGLVNQTYAVNNNFTLDKQFEQKKVGFDSFGQKESDTDSVITKLIEMSKDKVAFCYFELNSTNREYERFFPLGKQIENDDVRHWAALPEIIDLANYNSLTLGEVYVAEGDKLVGMPEFPDITSNLIYSYIQGLLNEILWVSMSYERKRRSYTSPLAVYIRAYDRIFCRQAATSLIDDDFSFTGYSTGKIRVTLDSEDSHERSRFAKKASSLFLIPQLSVID